MRTLVLVTGEGAGRALGITFDRAANAAYIALASIGPGDVARTHLVDDDQIRGTVSLDFNRAGQLIRIEVHEATQVLPADLLIPKTPRQRPDRAKLEGISPHLRYELAMLDIGTFLLVKRVVGEGPLRNALLESCLIHARNLRDFLYGPPQGPRGDDVLAEDFFVDPATWYQVQPTETPALHGTDPAGLSQRANKHLGHLTYERVTWPSPGPEWDVPRIRSDVLAGMLAFRKHADQPIGWSPPDG